MALRPSCTMRSVFVTVPIFSGHAVAANTTNERQLLARFEPEEIAELERLLRKLLRALEQPE